MATREYFPRRFRAAISQRTRWVTGIALQSWQRHGWNAPWLQLYWLWRDRKGLAGNLLTPVANLIFLYGTVSYGAHLGQGSAWHFGQLVPDWLSGICRLTLGIALLQATMRAGAAARLYGWRFASAVPLRMLWGNAVNFAATATALWEFWNAQARGGGLTWRKTDHVYPASLPAMTTGVAAVSRFRRIPDASAVAATGESY